MLGDLDIEGMSKGAAGDVSVMECGGRVTSMVEGYVYPILAITESISKLVKSISPSNLNN